MSLDEHYAILNALGLRRAAAAGRDRDTYCLLLTRDIIFYIELYVFGIHEIIYYCILNSMETLLDVHNRIVDSDPAGGVRCRSRGASEHGVFRGTGA